MADPARLLWRRARGASASIKTAYVGALTLYSLTGAPMLGGWANLAVVAGILVAVPLLVVAFHALTAPRDPLGGLLSPAPRTRAPLHEELARARSWGW